MTRPDKDTVTDWSDWPLEREIVIARIVEAPIETAFRAWADPTQIVQWFGPAGFRLETREIDIREGGLWRFDMIAPDGTRFSNRMTFLRIDAPHRIEAIHGADLDDDPDRFRLLVSFDGQDNGKTVVTLRQMHPTPDRRRMVIRFGAVEYGGQTLKKLADHVVGMAGG